MKKRILSLAAVFCLLAAMVPAPVRADDGAGAGESGTKMTGEELQSQINGAADGGTVKLTGDCETTRAYIYAMTLKELTIDLDGHTLTFHTPEPNASSNKCESQGLWAYGTAVTVKNGTIVSDSDKGAGDDGALATTLFINAGGSITLEDVTVKGSNQIEKSGYAAVLLGGTLTIGRGSSLESGKNAAVYCYGDGDNVVNVSGAVKHTGTFSAIEGSYTSTGSMTVNVHDGAAIDGGNGAGILQMSPGKTTVDGGSITGVSGIAMTKGELLISGGTVSGTGAYQDYTHTANYQVFDNGAAVYIEPVAAGTRVTVSGGTLRSANSYALSAPSGGNTGDNLTLAITGGTLIGSGAKGAIDAEGEAGAVSGGAFSSPVDSSLLNSELKFAAKKTSGDAPYSYHKTLSEAQSAAAGGKAGAVGPDGEPSGDGSSGGDSSGGNSSGSDSTATYTITIAGTSHGTVTANKTTAKQGETVTLTITPYSGYYLSSIYTSPSRTISGSGYTRTFTMPGSNVTVYATFSPNYSGPYLTGYVDIEGEPWVGETLYAVVYDTNNTGTLYYQWTADGYNLYGETSRYLNLTRYEVGKVIRCVVTSSIQTGSIAGRLWRRVDYYENRSPSNSSTGSNNGSTSSGTDQSTSGNNQNGFTIDSPIFTTATNADGTKTTTIIEPDGSSGLVLLTSYGTVASASMTFSSSAYTTARQTGSALTLPVSVQSSRSADSAAPVRIVLPAAGSIKVKIPVPRMTAGTVAVMENAFGPDTIIKSSVSGSDGVVFELTGSAVVKVVDNSRSFSDVSGGEWFANAVGWASSRGVMNGVSTQKFDPQGAMNRAMMTQLLYNFDAADDTSVSSQFSDVSSKDWYAASVSWAARNGIARNDGSRFGAEDALTREDMALMLYNYARGKGYSTSASSSTLAFPDNGDVSDWARSAMQWAVGAGLINGTQNGTKTVVLDPQGTVTRAQLATIMQRFNNLY